jgi:endonuclease/exonuclease/phosphatase family metal-dependent hydrolase
VPKQNTINVKGKSNNSLNIGGWILLILNYLAIVSIFISYIGAFVNPTFFPLPQFFSILYPVLFFVNAFFMFYWMFARRKYFLYSLIALLFGIGFINRTFNFSQARRYYPHPFKVLTYNVRLFNIYKWNGEGYTNHQIYQFINDKNPDIACLQEFISNKKIPVLERFKHLYPYYFIAYNTVQIKAGEIIFSRFPIKQTGKLEYEGHVFGIYADIDMNGEKMRVINVHLRSVYFAYSDYNSLDSLKFNNSRIKSITDKLIRGYRYRAQEVSILTSMIDTTTLPIVLCGDFNDTPVSYTYTQISRRLKDAFTVAGLGLGNTYNKIIPMLRIDYVFSSDQIHVLDYQRIKLKYSDHYPLLVELSKE